jgi:rubredoxin
MSDLIDRQAAIDGKISVQRTNGVEIYSDDVVPVKYLENLPSAQPKRIRGKWIYGEDSVADCVDGYRCDQCGFFVPWDYQHKSIDYIKDYNFCPHCGQKKEVEHDG